MAIDPLSGNNVNSPLSAKPLVKASADVKQQTVVSVSDKSLSVTIDASKRTDVTVANDKLTLVSRDTVDISAGVAAAASGTVPLVNEQKVAAIKAAIQSGSYQVNAARTAQKILQFENQLPNST